MNLLSRLVAYVRGVVARRRTLTEAEEELQFHLEQEEAANLERGMSPPEARRVARRDLGGLTQTQEQVRDVRSLWKDSWLRDQRQALRSLRRAPWYSGAAIAVITVSLALATTVFAIVDGVLFKPLPYPRANDLYVIGGPEGYFATIRDVQEWARAVPEAQFATFTMTFTIGAVGETRPTSIEAARIGPEFLAVLGTSPLIGGLLPMQFEPSAGPIPALISYGLWQRAYGASPAVVGLRLNVSGAVDHIGRSLPGIEVAGVLPREFVFPDGSAPDVLLPVALTPKQQEDRNESVARALVRVPPGLQTSVLKARINAIAATQGFPEPEQPAAEQSVNVDRLDASTTWAQKETSWVAFAMAVLIVLLACVNVAGLGQARRRNRKREYSVREALGAGRWQLIRLAIAEVTPLVVTGAAGGLLVAPLLLRVVMRSKPEDMVLLKVPSIDWRVIAFATVAVTLSIAVGVGVQWRAPGNFNPTDALGRAATTTPRRGRLSGFAVATQVALALILTISGTLVVSSLWLNWQQDPGYDIDHSVVVKVDVRAGTVEERTERVRRLLDEIRALPGVQGAAAMDAPMLERAALSPAIQRPDSARQGREQAIPVSRDFFEVMGLSVLQGRLPTPGELDSHAPVLVVSDRAAKALWPDQLAVGQSLTAANGRFVWTVIGVVPDAQYVALGNTRFGQIYRPLDGSQSPTILVRSHGPASGLIDAVLKQTRSSTSRVELLRALTMKEALGESIRFRTLVAWSFGAFSVSALIVTAVGILGLVAISTVRRKREIGVRLALGATRAGVVEMCVREQAVAVLAGLLAGGLVSAWTVQFLKAYLYQFTVYDARLWGLAVMTILVTAALGTLIPALRASRIDPVEALRAE